MGMQNNDQKIWVITDFSLLVHEEDDTGVKTEGMMEIQSLDVLKQYHGANRKLMIAVKVTDKKTKPIALAEVGLFIAQSKADSISMFRYTDSEGVAFFEITNPHSGKLFAGVTSIRHPSYANDKAKLREKWITIRL